MPYPEMQQGFVSDKDPSSPSSVTSSITIRATTEKVFHPTRNDASVQSNLASVGHNARNWPLSQKVAVSIGAILCFLVM
jgi:hypothetical protein